MRQITEPELEKLKYPIGKFVKPNHIDKAVLNLWISEIENLPGQVRKIVDKMNEEQLNTPYRKEGWTIKQVIHHLPDSHMNAYTRFHLALTEDTPTIKPYFENRWAELADGKNAPIEFSLNLLSSLHQRWVYLLKSLTEEQLARTIIHPEFHKEYNLEELIGLYAHHGKHHLEQIKNLKSRQNWK